MRTQPGRHAVVLLVAMLGLQSCGGDLLDSVKPGTVGCDFRKGSLNGPEARCQDRTMIAAEWFGVGCLTSGGETLSGECPREGIIAGCLLDGSNPTQVATDWYYPETADGTPGDRLTRDDVARQCESDGKLVDP